MSGFLLHQRVQDHDGYKATVRYIGPVAASKNIHETWIGVEWDDKTRGKHDGSCVDKAGIFHRYFECEMGAGSFVKPTKLKPPYSYYSAIHDRYVALNAPEIATENILPDAFVRTASGAVKNIEFVGEVKLRKWQQIDKITKIAMRSAGISRINDGSHQTSDPEEHEAVIKVEELIGTHLEDIDLQDNLIYQWKEVNKLCRQVPALKTLQLHNNTMEAFTNDTILQLTKFTEASSCSNPKCDADLSSIPPSITVPNTYLKQIQVLALNNCGLNSWKQVLYLSACIPHIRELYLTGNDFRDMEAVTRASFEIHGYKNNVNTGGDGIATVFNKLDVSNSDCNDSIGGVAIALNECIVLDVAHCHIHDWNTLLTALGNTNTINAADATNTNSNPYTVLSVPNLTDLLVDGNPIPTVQSVDVCILKKLQRLSMSSSKISSWRCIDHLAMHYKQLHNIRVTHVPLFVGKGVSEVRPLVIGRIQQLKFFNGSGVSARERVDGEKAYLRKIKREILEFKPETHSYNEHVGEDNCKEARIPSAILENHPRYKELDDRYGEELLPMGDPTRNNATISEDLVQLTFNNLCFGGNATNEPIVRKLPSNINIKSLKQLCKSIFNLDLTIDVLSISLRCYQDRDVPPTLLDDDSNSLHYYGVGIEGGDIYINELKH